MPILRVKLAAAANLCIELIRGALFAAVNPGTAIIFWVPLNVPLLPAATAAWPAEFWRAEPADYLRKMTAQSCSAAKRMVGLLRHAADTRTGRPAKRLPPPVALASCAVALSRRVHVQVRVDPRTLEPGGEEPGAPSRVKRPAYAITSVAWQPALE